LGKKEKNRGILWEKKTLPAGENHKVGPQQGKKKQKGQGKSVDNLFGKILAGNLRKKCGTNGRGCKGFGKGKTPPRKGGGTGEKVPRMLS